MSKMFFRMRDLATTSKRKGRYPVSPATIWRWVAAGKFPPPVKLSAGVTAWNGDQLDAFDAQCTGEGRAMVLTLDASGGISIHAAAQIAALPDEKKAAAAGGKTPLIENKRLLTGGV